MRTAWLSRLPLPSRRLATNLSIPRAMSSTARTHTRPRQEDIHEHSYGIVPVALCSPPRVLLVQQRSQEHHWGVPKGHAEPGETALQAAIRELEEETGLRATRFLPAPTPSSAPGGVDAAGLEHDGKDAIHGEPYRNPRRNDGWKSNVYFVALFDAALAQPSSTGSLRLQADEVEQAVWLELGDAMERCTYEEGKRVVQQAQAWLRAHRLIPQH